MIWCSVVVRRELLPFSRRSLVNTPEMVLLQLKVNVCDVYMWLVVYVERHVCIEHSDDTILVQSSVIDLTASHPYPYYR